MKVHDSLNNQFRLHYYIAKLNANLLQYLENNNIDINYYCFFSKIVDNIHYVITSQTTKRKLNGYRLVTIQDVEKDNSIYVYDDNLNFVFDGINIKVTPVIDDINDISNKLGIIITDFHGKLMDDGLIDYYDTYDKNILESNVTEVDNLMNLNVLNNFENLKILTFGVLYNPIIGTDVLPNTLQKLYLGHCFNQIIGVSVLPNSLQELYLGHCYNQIIGVDVLPSSLQTLTFSWIYNQIIGVNVLPNSLQALTFSYNYNQLISENVLPNSLQTLTFSWLYNQIIGVNVLPNSLKTLTFGGLYQQILHVNVLPNSLQILNFGYYYNQIICEIVLPNSLQVININFYGRGKKSCREQLVPPTFHNIIRYINIKD
jgi:hypothetical protein